MEEYSDESDFSHSSGATNAYLRLEPVGLLGQGGFGAVILARCPLTERPYAVKMIPIKIPKIHRKGYSKTKYAALMRNELSVLSLTARERIPFCLSLIAHDFTDKHLRIVTEFGARGSLFDLLLNPPGTNEKRRRPRSKKADKTVFNQRLARFYCAELVVGVGFLHNQDIIHRDLGPANILVDFSGHLLISDFGLSVKAKTHNARQGNYEYNAPEMLRNDTYDCSVDWWSVGLILHFMLTGKNPAWNPSLREEDNVERIVTERPINWSNINSKSAKLIDFLKRTVKHNPKLRLGRRGFEEVMQHPYLAKFSVRSLINKEMPPPLPGILNQTKYLPDVDAPIGRKLQASLNATPLDFREPYSVNFY